MKEVIFLIDPNTGNYFTNNDEGYWNKNIEEAYPYNVDDNINEIIKLMTINNTYHNILNGISYIIPQKTFIIC